MASAARLRRGAVSGSLKTKGPEAALLSGFRPRTSSSPSGAQFSLGSQRQVLWLHSVPAPQVPPQLALQTQAQALASGW